MENATKALLIAAAVLVAILIISLGLVVYNMAAETIGSVNLNEQQIAAHNEKFIRYEGTQKGTAVNGMLRTVLTSNMAAEDESRKVQVTGAVTLGTSATSITSKADTGATYTVTTTLDTNTGLVTTINVTKKGTTTK